jgi:mono/diheme cytochrome c family protein
MKKMKYSYLLLISGVLFLFIQSCSKSSTDSSSLYTPTSVDVTPSATLVDLQQGRILYINNCGRCHGLYSPDNFSSTQWKSIISSMAPNTGLSASDILLVTKYVTRGN